MKSIMCSQLILLLTFDCLLHIKLAYGACGSPYNNAGECTDQSILATKITDTTVLTVTYPAGIINSWDGKTVDWTFGFTSSVPSCSYCAHDAYYDFQITYTTGTGDSAANFIMEYYPMVISATTNLC